MVKFLIHLFRKDKPLMIIKDTPGYYANLFSMLVGFKIMMDSKKLTYPFSGLANHVFEKSDYSLLTPDEQAETENLIDSMITEILFFKAVNSGIMTPERLADMASTELVCMSARIFQNIPIFGDIIIN